MPPSSDSWKIAILVVVGLVVCINITALTIAYRSSYLPLKARQLFPMFSILVAMTCWFYGNLQSLSVLDITVFSDCRFYCLWMQLCLGVNFFIMTMTYRMQRLYYIAVLKRPLAGVGYYFPLIALGCPVVITSAIPHFVEGLISPTPVLDAAGFLGCVFYNIPYMLSTYVIIFIQCLYLLYLNSKIAKIKESFNEYLEMKYSLSIGLVCLVANSVISVSGYWRQPWGAIAIVCLNLLSGNSPFWAVLYKPMYGYFFDRKESLRRFHNGFKTVMVKSVRNVPAFREKYGTMAPQGATPTTHDSLLPEQNQRHFEMTRISNHHAEQPDSDIITELR
ncbi:hypothetical protein HDV03_003467 [Kappamyces sp. JEL0829]|nr:hypothetical protein HDV03_003467 [Kappamyces sp. JEL0829]